MIVRPADLADLNACLLFDHTVFTEHVWQMQVREAEAQLAVTFQSVRLPRRMQVEYPHNVEQLVEHWQQGETILVAEEEGEVKGYVDMVTQPWHEAGWVANLCVDRAARQQGVAMALLRYARQWARGEGLAFLHAEATTKNYPALSLYRKLGFEFCGFNDHYYLNQDIALFFVQVLR
ncbi:MAG: GNAT family N-acetyltransferase [Anaerolineae bacterium]|nr:GNAT family N-acetyltransferase [Anaerolineae bacterium]